MVGYYNIVNDHGLDTSSISLPVADWGGRKAVHARVRKTLHHSSSSKHVKRSKLPLSKQSVHVNARSQPSKGTLKSAHVHENVHASTSSTSGDELNCFINDCKVEYYHHNDKKSAGNAGNILDKKEIKNNAFKSADKNIIRSSFNKEKTSTSVLKIKESDQGGTKRSMVTQDQQQQHNDSIQADKRTTKKCKFPFIADGKTHFTCVASNDEKNQKWCGTTSNYDRDMKWMYCGDDDLDKTELDHKSETTQFLKLKNKVSIPDLDKVSLRGGWMNYSGDNGLLRMFPRNNSSDNGVLKMFEEATETSDGDKRVKVQRNGNMTSLSSKVFIFTKNNETESAKSVETSPSSGIGDSTSTFTKNNDISSKNKVNSIENWAKNISVTQKDDSKKEFIGNDGAGADASATTKDEDEVSALVPESDEDHYANVNEGEGPTTSKDKSEKSVVGGLDKSKFVQNLKQDNMTILKAIGEKNTDINGEQDSQEFIDKSKGGLTHDNTTIVSAFENDSKEKSGESKESNKEEKSNETDGKKESKEDEDEKSLKTKGEKEENESLVDKMDSKEEKSKTNESDDKAKEGKDKLKNYGEKVSPENSDKDTSSGDKEGSGDNKERKKHEKLSNIISSKAASFVKSLAKKITKEQSEGLDTLTEFLERIDDKSLAEFEKGDYTSTENGKNDLVNYVSDLLLKNRTSLKKHGITDDDKEDTKKGVSLLPGAKNINIFIINHRSDKLDMKEMQDIISQTSKTKDADLSGHTKSQEPDSSKNDTKSGKNIADIVNTFLNADSKSDEKTLTQNEKENSKIDQNKAANEKSNVNKEGSAAASNEPTNTTLASAINHEQQPNYRMHKNESLFDLSFLNEGSNVDVSWENETKQVEFITRKKQKKPVEHQLPTSRDTQGKLHKSNEQIAIPTYGGNGDHKKCVFPFLFEGSSYFDCITTPREPKPWCSVTGNYDRMPIWGYCDKEHPYIRTTPKRNRPEQIEGVKGEKYYAMDERNKKEQVQDENYGIVEGTKTIGGNANGKLCVFPFVYDGETYTDCIPRDDGTSWCAVTRSYDSHPIWGNCCNGMHCHTEHFVTVKKNEINVFRKMKNKLGILQRQS